MSNTDWFGFQNGQNLLSAAMVFLEECKSNAKEKNISTSFNNDVESSLSDDDSSENNFDYFTLVGIIIIAYDISQFVDC